MEAERPLLSYGERVKHRVKTCCSRSDFSAQSFRGIMVGSLIATSIADVVTYLMLMESVKVGQLPEYVGVVSITCIAGLEVLLAPLISWMGYSRRLRVIMLYQVVGVVLSISLILLPSAGSNNSTGLCEQSGVQVAAASGITTATIVRLVFLGSFAVLNVFVRVGCWSHALAKLDEYSSETASLDVGILVCAKVLGLSMAPSVVGDLSVGSLWLKIIFVPVGLIIHTIQMLLIKDETQEGEDIKPMIPQNDRGFTPTLLRVISNKIVMSQALSAGLLASALFGFSYNETNFVKTAYNHVRDPIMSINYAFMVRYHYVAALVVFFGILYKKPLMMQFKKLHVLAMIIKVTLICSVMYLAMTLLNCDKGDMAGVNGDTFVQPACSNNCRCASRAEFMPVCVSQNLVTYASPCHAGCSTTATVNGLLSYTNCTCTESGWATVGACSARSCAGLLGLHDLFFCSAILFTILAFSAQLVLILRTVDPRDRSVAIGVCSATVALLAFVIGNMGLYAVRQSTCLWYEGVTCQLHKVSFQHWTGGFSTTLTFLSAIITILTLVCSRQKLREEKVEMVPVETRDETAA